MISKKLSMQQLTQKRKELLKIKPITLDVQQKINEIDKMIAKKVNLSDQNFFRTFYKIAKEQMNREAFLEVEGITNTRMNDYKKGKTA